jgi:monovalent cation:H+ antiporter-2, CPA2 family
VARAADRRGVPIRVRFKTGPCSHVDQISAVTPASEGCVECLALGDTWVHLRLCLRCGHVGCCDSSKNRHARAHARECEHAIVRSFEPGEDWMWCYVDEVFVAAPAATGGSA